MKNLNILIFVLSILISKYQLAESTWCYQCYTLPDSKWCVAPLVPNSNANLISCYGNCASWWTKDGSRDVLNRGCSEGISADVRSAYNCNGDKCNEYSATSPSASTVPTFPTDPTTQSPIPSNGRIHCYQCYNGMYGYTIPGVPANWCFDPVASPTSGNDDYCEAGEVCMVGISMVGSNQIINRGCGRKNNFGQDTINGNVVSIVQVCNTDYCNRNVNIFNTQASTATTQTTNIFTSTTSVPTTASTIASTTASTTIYLSSTTTTTTISTATTTTITTTTTKPTTTTMSIDAFNQECVKAHNDKRALHSNTPPLTYNAKLAQVAQAYADKMCLVNPFVHNADRTANYGTGEYVGENMCGGTSTCTQCVGLWYNEINLPSPYNYANNNYDSARGHFTQVVWAKTREVGCGICRARNLLICNYIEGGNYGGQFTANIFPPK